MPTTTPAARVLGCLSAADALIRQAQTLAPDTASDLEPVLRALGAEIEAAEATLSHDLNHQLAALLPQGFAYLPD